MSDFSDFGGTITVDALDIRRQTLAQATTVVVKVGTNVLTDERGILDRNRVQSLADQLHRIRATGRRVALVSSGAIAAGMGRLRLPKRPTELPHLQACASIGQAALIQLYQDCFTPYQVTTAQILLTAGDFDSRVRYLNARNTIGTLLEWNILPIINENDTVSTAEIRVGDNDYLAAMVTNLLRAPLLIILTSVDGLYSADPRIDPNAQLLSVVASIDRSVTELAGSSKTSLGTGGMRSKLRAARLATAAGEAVIIANGATPGILDAIFAESMVGTLFLPHGEAMPSWKRWLGYTARPKGRLCIDEGAMKAVRELGRSLLPIGIVSVEGIFGKGDLIAICDRQGSEFARGLSNYSSIDAERIRGLRTEQIAERLGRLPYVECIHRDNLALLG